MKNKALWIIFAMFAFTPCLFASIHVERVEVKSVQTEKFLKNAKIKDILKDLEGGRTEFWQVGLEKDGLQKKAIFKYVNRRRPHIVPDSYQYELAAYKLNALMGLNIVPPCVHRTVDGVEGSLQILIENCIDERERQGKNIPFPDKQCLKEIEDIKIFEILVADEYWDIDDTLMDCDSGKIWRVDFSEAFSPIVEWDQKWIFQCCSQELYQSLMDWKDSQVRETLAPYLNSQEMDALMKRKASILNKINNLISNKGEKKIIR